MGLFGSGPKKRYIFIYYHDKAPTKAEQDKIVSAYAKGKTVAAFGQSQKIEDEYWFGPPPVRDAYLKALSSIYLAKNAVGSSGTLKYDTRQENGFYVTTVSGDLD